MSDGLSNASLDAVVEAIRAACDTPLEVGKWHKDAIAMMLTILADRVKAGLVSGFEIKWEGEKVNVTQVLHVPLPPHHISIDVNLDKQ